ncbi:hypothetical protein CY0110_17127 [Crocosphaera chwakensis CCY0110]|uniref:Uncharacterized protein n=1 Tax=Crocosphaera chwakensis CCY0110 TaxID=391612 RepID=A3IIA7_9CHRO|nr:hypothetical protein CY0110_17127 [Crocosphaera chwakensis CCY0110]
MMYTNPHPAILTTKAIKALPSNNSIKVKPVSGFFSLIRGKILLIFIRLIYSKFWVFVNNNLSFFF